MRQSRTIYDKKKDFSQRTSSITVPSVLNDPSFFDNSIHPNEQIVKASEKNILSEEDKALLFDEEFYSQFQYGSRERISLPEGQYHSLRSKEYHLYKAEKRERHGNL